MSTYVHANPNAEDVTFCMNPQHYPANLDGFHKDLPQGHVWVTHAVSVGTLFTCTGENDPAIHAVMEALGFILVPN